MMNKCTVEDIIKDYGKLWDENLSEEEIDEIIDFYERNEERPPMYSVSCFDEETDESIDHMLVLKQKSEHNYRCVKCGKTLCNIKESDIADQYSTILQFDCDCGCSYKVYVGTRYEYKN